MSNCTKQKRWYIAGATEIDVVVNVTWIKSGQWDKVDKELEQLSALISSHNAVFKLIFETAYLTSDEIMQLADLCLKNKVHYLKPQLVLRPRGAELEVVKAIKARIGDQAKIKASVVFLIGILPLLSWSRSRQE